jgi:hypothetical protein
LSSGAPLNCDLMLLTARMQSIAQADREAAAAAATETSLRATKADVANLTQGSTAIAVLKAKLSSASPTVSITALATVRAFVNGNVDELSDGQTLTAAPANATQMTIGTLAQILVVGANDLRQLERELEVAVRDHQRILDQLGVKTIEEAEEQRQRRERASDQAAAARRAATAHLLDLTREGMREKIARLEAAIDAYAPDRPAAATPPPQTPADAKARADDARAVFNQTRSALEDIAEHLKAATAATATAQAAAAAAQATWASRAESRDRVAKSLANARAEQTDEVLQAHLTAARGVAATAVAARDAANAAYEKADPEMVTAGLAAAEKALANHEQNLRRIHDEMNRLKARLDVNGESGLEETHQQAQRDVFVTQDAAARHRRRAQAAKLLYETLQSCRDTAQKSYVAPLKGEIERLGRRIFGEEFSVVMGESLGVEARVMNGTVIPYSNLSSGTKEQIGILQRLATARLVGKGGVPLLLDDAVAYTDAVRQETLAAALGFASADAQTIIVTCAPEKYAHAPIEVRIDF